MERVNSRCNPELKQLMNFHTEAEIERENKLEVDSRMQLPKFDAPVCVYGNWWLSHREREAKDIMQGDNRAYE